MHRQFSHRLLLAMKTRPIPSKIFMCTVWMVVASPAWWSCCFDGCRTTLLTFLIVSFGSSSWRWAHHTKKNWGWIESSTGLWTKLTKNLSCHPVDYPGNNTIQDKTASTVNSNLSGQPLLSHWDFPLIYPCLLCAFTSSTASHYADSSGTVRPTKPSPRGWKSLTAS